MTERELNALKVALEQAYNEAIRQNIELRARVAYLKSEIEEANNQKLNELNETLKQAGDGP